MVVVVGAAEPTAGAATGASDGVAEPALELEPAATTAEPVAGFGGSPQPPLARDEGDREDPERGGSHRRLA